MYGFDKDLHQNCDIQAIEHGQYDHNGEKIGCLGK